MHTYQTPTVPRGVRVPGIFTLSLLMLVHRPSACICIHYIKFCEDKTTMYFLNVLVRVGVLGNNSCILLSVRKFKWGFIDISQAAIQL